MANCESNILQVPLRANPPAPDDVIIITHSDGKSELITIATLLASLSPTDIEFEVGDTGFPVAGATTYTVPGGVGKRVKLFRNTILQSVRRGDYSFDPSSGIITFTTQLSDEELIQIQVY